jgi:peptidoglycan hydrolase-like protein with peptidoglycan-binding domain
MNRATQTRSRDEIQQAQEELKTQGLYRGQVDGVMGRETRTALSRYQRQQGLPATAQIDDQTYSRLLNAQNPGKPNAQPVSTGAQPQPQMNGGQPQTGTQPQPGPSNSPMIR